MSAYYVALNFPNVDFIYRNVKQRLTSDFERKWRADCQTSPKARTYRLVKTKFEREWYLSNLPVDKCIQLCRFRCSNHNLPIETGRHRRIPREERLCQLCNFGVLGDERHAILECPAFNTLRAKLLPLHFSTIPDVISLKVLLTTKHVQLLSNLSALCTVIYKTLK